MIARAMLAAAILAAAILAAAACQGTATQTSPIFLTDVLTGTVAAGAPSFHIAKTFAFSSTTLGLSDLSPNTGVAIGVGLGTPPADPSGNCSVQVFKILKVGESYEISGVPSSTYCVSVFEFVSNGIGAVPDPLSYTVKFNHH